MIAFIHALQMLNGLTWLVGLGCNTPALYRMWFGVPRRTDPYFSIAWFVALSQIGFSARWMIWPTDGEGMPDAEMQFWAACYFCNGIAPIILIACRRLLR